MDNGTAITAKSTLNINEAIQFGWLVQAAYAIDPTDLKNRQNCRIDPQYDPYKIGYEIVTSLYGCDWSSEVDRDPLAAPIVSMGYVVQSDDGDVVIAIRGTRTPPEWIHDAEFLALPCPVLFPSSGFTEDGFTAMYESLRTTSDKNGPLLIENLASLPFKKPVGSLTICGHSLGSAIATLLAFDVAAHQIVFKDLAIFKDLNVYTFASPRVGDMLFARSYNAAVPNNYRIYNRCDIVPQLPPIMPVIYEHVAGGFELIPADVEWSLECEHSLITYLHLLGKFAVAKVQTDLENNCCRTSHAAAAIPSNTTRGVSVG